MVEEIILRIVNRNLYDLQREIAALLEPHIKVRLVDDSVLNPDFIEVFRSYEQIIVISQDIVVPEIVDKKRVSYFKMSRVFNEPGEHVGWFIPSISPLMISADSSIKEILKFDQGQCCILDSDVATGSTRSLALQLFSGADFYAPIKLEPEQDLIDVEDLVSERSLMWKDGRFQSVSYLLNEKFFLKRTSIPTDKFDQIKEMVKNSSNLLNV